MSWYVCINIAQLIVKKIIHNKSLRAERAWLMTDNRQQTESEQDVSPFSNSLMHSSLNTLIKGAVSFSAALFCMIHHSK